MSGTWRIFGTVKIGIMSKVALLNPCDPGRPT
jgi:hypothetical protein